MTQISIFCKSDIRTLEREVNDWLRENDNVIDVKSITHQAADNFSEIIIVYVVHIEKENPFV